MTQLVLECRNIKKCYAEGPQRVEVLRGVELQLHASESIAIVGASGSGKSTLLNMLGGLDKPDDGEVRLLDKAFSDCNENVRGDLRNQYLGFVYQFHHLLPEFTAIENVSMPLLIRGLSRKAAAVEAMGLLERVGLQARGLHKPAELSGGERQRVAIARALVNKPACVLMDEPTGNLDEDNAEAIQKLMLDLSKQSQTAFVVVTHDQQLARKMHRCFRLDHGKLEPQL